MYFIYDLAKDGNMAMFTSSRRSFIALCSILLVACKQNVTAREDDSISDSSGCWCINSKRVIRNGSCFNEVEYQLNDYGNIIQESQDTLGGSYFRYDEFGNCIESQSYLVEPFELSIRAKHDSTVNALGLPTSIDIQTSVASGNFEVDDVSYVSDNKETQTTIDYYPNNRIKSFCTRTSYPDDDLMVDISDAWTLDDVKITYERGEYDNNGMLQSFITDYLRYSDSNSYDQDELDMGLNREETIYCYSSIDNAHIDIHTTKIYDEGIEESYFEGEFLSWCKEGDSKFEYDQDGRVAVIYFFGGDNPTPVSYENGRAFLELSRESSDDISIELDEHGNTSKIIVDDEIYEYEYVYVETPLIVCRTRSAIHPMPDFLYPCGL